MGTLATRSDVVLMDLRGFAHGRAGCCFELRQLAASSTAEPVVQMINNDSELAPIPELVEVPDAPWRIANLAKSSQDLTAFLFEAMAAVMKRDHPH